MIRAARGATTTDRDHAGDIRQAVTELLEQLVGINNIQADAVLSVFISVTPDLHAISPARIMREALGWSNVPIMSALEPVIEGLPPYCIRILVQFETDRPRSEIRMVYLRNARQLRPDLV